MNVSAHDGSAAAATIEGLELCSGVADIVELASHRGREVGLRALAASRGQPLPPFGRAAAEHGRLALCVRPGRWLLMQPRRAGGEGARAWQGVCDGLGSAVDLSSGLALFLLRGPLAAELLDRHCRLDLRRERFGSGRAAATLMAQVPIMIVARPRGLLLATPSSTSRHFREWLGTAGRPFGFRGPRAVPTEELLGE